MNKLKVSVNKAARIVAQNMIRREKDKWPPDCPYFGFQPKRPASVYKSDKPEEKR